MDVDTAEDIGAPAERANAQAGPSSRQVTNEGSSSLDAMLSMLDAHTMRVTRGGQIRHYVQFALRFLDEHPERPLTLHTLPANSPAQPQKLASRTKQRKVSSLEGEQSSSESEQDVSEPTTDSRKHTRSTSTIVSATIPRLISVVEIIKREYLKSRPKARIKVGLFQYNEMNWLEKEEKTTKETNEKGEDDASEEMKRAQMIIETLDGGKKHLPIRRTPYLKVTLCTQELDPKWISSRMTVQPPATQRMSKSARGREVRRRRKENAKKNLTETANELQNIDKSSEEGVKAATRKKNDESS